MKAKIIHTVVLLILFPYFINAQSSIKSIDQLLNSYNKKGQFDGSILIGEETKIIYSKHYGLANRQFHVDITDDTKFPVASITKLYTAVLILKLQEMGKVNIDSSIYTYIPDLLPKVNKLITIKQLLIHVSGLPNEKVSAYYKSLLNIRDFVTTNISDTLLNHPGSKYSYNNVNYIILGAIIEKVTQKKWQQVFYETIVQPLKLTNTGVVKTDSVINNLAYGYHNYAFGDLPAKPLKNDGFVYMENYATAGAIFTNTQDLFKFHLALTGNKLLNNSSKKVMYTPEIALGKVEHTEYYDYFVNLGSFIGERKFKGQKPPITAIERPGNINGFNATYVQLPKNKKILIILCNTDAGDLNKITAEVLSLIDNTL